jgi:hypothetical protein
MEIQEAFDSIREKLKAASARGVAPSIRVSGEDWVCTIEERNKKSVFIAKKDELVIVDMPSNNSEPKIERIAVPEDDRQKVIDRIKEAVTAAYGTLPTA